MLPSTLLRIGKQGNGGEARTGTGAADLPPVYEGMKTTKKTLDSRLTISDLTFQVALTIFVSITSIDRKRWLA
jgi:hypothetical protein